MAPAAWERSSQGWVKNRRPGVQKRKPRGFNFAPRGSNFAPRGVPNGLLDSSWGVLGARSASEGRYGRKRGVGKLYGGLLGPSWGPLGASWARFGSHFAPPGDDFRPSEPPFGDFSNILVKTRQTIQTKKPRYPRDSIATQRWVGGAFQRGPRGGFRRSFLYLLGRPGRDLKKMFFIVVLHVWGLFFFAYVALCCLPCSVAGGVVHMQKKLKCRWVFGSQAICALFWQRPTQSTFRGDAQQISMKKELEKKRAHGTRQQGQQKSSFETNIAPKMDPGGFQKRVHKTVGN